MKEKIPIKKNTGRFNQKDSFIRDACLLCSDIDSVTYSTVRNGNIPGFLKGTPVDIDGDEYLAFPCETMLSVSDCIDKQIAKLYPVLVKSVCDALYSINEYMLDGSFVRFSKSRLFCSTSGESSGFILSKKEYNSDNPKESARSLITELTADYKANCELTPSERALADYITDNIDKCNDFSTVRLLCEKITAVDKPGIPVFLETDHGAIFVQKNQVETIGRDSSCSMCIDMSTHISRRHAKTVWNEGKVLFTDTGSSNGSALNGKRIENGKSVALENGDRLRLADVNLIFYA